ncbi:MULTISPECIES: N-acetylmuramoyl-L-alanine amidase [Macrococcus]|uniref:N-acetylmuramoyl-L-alanine amidase n=1 Tax=Macrococcus psychrotolerans TaxID=3039389 RepID=A0AAU6R7Q9_9STAP|nr:MULTISPECIES: N-acetylmuramoyl-L-alanine amidase [Macrococcus]MDJ1111372.1 N-acetylmuramoyl-L-alanine amidase [Macrococcus sp. S115]QYA32123.1 N-acetylmuramoyl-L-alanine amidase [Macrococcus sp. 19Msa1099]QYA36928.1 N-acetylmuramoyl-L-alanine amidase [Macrococcus caseolyticus]QYA75636.1 N-acetylmuramoyl-L-alanine amidase [Macrococcus caseolyticus]
MTKIKLTTKALKLLLALSLLVLIVLIMFAFIAKQENPKRLSLVEDNSLRTGPSAMYPEIFKVEKGESFKILKQDKKWFFVQNDEKKGWIAGWHTNLNIKRDHVHQEHPLKNKTIIIDAGHGGADQGASSRNGTKEKEITLKTGLMLRDKLQDEGANVIMTRATDEYVKLNDRKGKADAFLSIHADALEGSAPHGLTVYYYRDSQKMLADTLHMAIKKKALLSDRGVRQENFQVIRQTKQPAVLLELGYISNPTDEHMMNDQIYRQITTTSIVDGLRNYFSY